MEIRNLRLYGTANIAEIVVAPGAIPAAAEAGSDNPTQDRDAGGMISAASLSKSMGIGPSRPLRSTSSLSLAACSAQVHISRCSRTALRFSGSPVMRDAKATQSAVMAARSDAISQRNVSSS
jgi:hypothetical protein